jgi:hypothetical protein
MPRKVLPRIDSVSPGDKPPSLRVRWQKDGESLIDVPAEIDARPALTATPAGVTVLAMSRVGILCALLIVGCVLMLAGCGGHAVLEQYYPPDQPSGNSHAGSGGA